MHDKDLFWLQSWFYNHCDGDWEHTTIIKIETLDNPGWSLTINIEETEVVDKVFIPYEIERSKNDWLTCFVKDNKFEVRCGPINLLEGINRFRIWVEENS